MLAVLVDQRVGGVPDPAEPVTLGRRRVEQLHVVEDGLGGVFKENFTVTILQGQAMRETVLVVIAKRNTEFYVLNCKRSFLKSITLVYKIKHADTLM